MNRTIKTHLARPARGKPLPKSPFGFDYSLNGVHFSFIMANYSDGLTISETTAGLIRAYDAAQKSLSIISDSLDCAGNDAAAKEMENLLPHYNAYIDAIFGIIQTSIMENRGNRDSAKI